MKKTLRGITLIETLVSLIIISLCTVVMVRLSAVKLDDQQSMDEQYSLINVDGTLSDIYKDFQSCYSVDVADTDGGGVVLYFTLWDGVSTYYEFRPHVVTNEDRSIQVRRSGSFYKDGIEQFKCSGFRVNTSENYLSATILLENEQDMTITVFR